MLVYNVTSNSEIVELAERDGIRCGRVALREEGTTVHAYCVGFRDEGVIGHLPIDFP